MLETSIFVTFTFEGWHRWEGATGQRAYLANSHRHIFHVRVEVTVNHHDREVEFHDLRDFISDVCPSGDLGPMSCEMVAAEILSQLRSK